MRIRFDPDFDGGAWPGPLDGKDAVAGEAWLGELGLLATLETVLGLSGPVATSGERAAALVPGLRANEGFWSRSAEQDPLGSARELLRWRDELVLAGWRGSGNDVPERVASLARLEGDVLAGAPDRLWGVSEALARRSGEVAVLELLEPLDRLPVAWQSVMRALGGQGASIIEIDLAAAAAVGDLAAARAMGFRPGGDGSLQLIRPDGPWAAAVEVAAWLSSRELAGGTVIVSPTPLLDTELRRFGLPATGAREIRGGSSVLEILPLILALGWQPASPGEAAALLSLPESPVPRGIRNRLRRALSDWPAVGSDSWKLALKDGLEAIENEDRRRRVAERLTSIFEDGVDRTGSGYPVAKIRKRTALVRDWLRGRRATLDEATEADLARALEEALLQCLTFERIVDLAGLESWSGADLQRFLDEARSGLAAESVLPAEAGMASVAAPGAVAGPARCVVWWDFSRSMAPRLTRLPFTNAERAQLADAGVQLQPPAERAVRHAQRWRRPLDQATETLLLVSPRANEVGDESHPHPLWDEIAARLDREGGSSREAFLRGALYAEPRPTLEAQPLRPPPAALRQWNVAPELVPLPAQASHAAIQDLLRCSMRWALRRVAKLEGPAEIEVGLSNLVLGRLAHVLLESVLPAAAGDPAEARKLAEVWFDENAPKHVAALFLPGQEAETARTRRIMVDSAELFTHFTRDAGLSLHSAEQRIEGTGLGRTIFGIPDLVLGPKPVIVDAKWGGLTYRHDALASGTATQLAFYAHLLGQQEGFKESAAAVAYFVLSRGRILTTDPDLGGRAESVAGPSHAETWLALERAFNARKEELKNGVLLATANPDLDGGGVVDRDRVDENGAVVLRPECHWCEYGVLCGAGLQQARE